MPEKRTIFILPVLVHVHAVADTLLSLPKRGAFGKVTCVEKHLLLPQMTASLYLGRDAGLRFFGASALDAYRPGGLFPLRGAPGGPSPGAPVALSGCRVMAYRNQSNCSLSPHANLTK